MKTIRSMEMSMPTRIRRVEFINFKAFSNFALNLSEVDILVGPNNSGKSTIIGALRTLDAAIRFAKTRSPTRLQIGEGSVLGYRIPHESVPISLENVHTDYNDQESRIKFILSNGNSLALVFPEDGGCILIPDANGRVVTSAAAFKRDFPVSVLVVPVLGPVEHNEIRRERATVMAGLSTHRASRHFRSYWHYHPDGFEKFSELVSRTWPSMSINPPELNLATGELSMFCSEGRMPREIYWVGFGFQVWCQLLTHISRATDGSLVVVDEPEVYLHPDIQRQLLGIIRDTGADVLLATHSSEIITEAEPSEIVLIDKRRQSGERLKNVAGVQRALERVGSCQNITLTSLARSRRVLFVEGLDDFRLLRRFARKLGMQEMSAGVGIMPLQSGGFGSWERITVLASGIAEALGAPLMIGAIYDRDYYCDEQIADIINKLDNNLPFARVLNRKEIENYLLMPAALDRAIERAVRAHNERSSKTHKTISSIELIQEITDPMKHDVLAQLVARRDGFLPPTKLDKSHQFRDTFNHFEYRWSQFDSRLCLVPGKEVLGKLRQRVQEICGVTLTDARIIDCARQEDIPTDMHNLLIGLEKFRTDRH